MFKHRSKTSSRARRAGRSVNAFSPELLEQRTLMSATLWTDADVPAVPSFGSLASGPAELGLRFYTDTPGYISGIRYYKGAGTGDTHIGSLWTSDGVPLARATFQAETASGWQQVNFESPVPVAANTTYVASYYTRSGKYALNEGYFASAGVDRGPLHAPQDGVGGANGLYVLNGVSTFPTSTFNSRNYWVDVAFDTTLTPKVNAVEAFDGNPDGVWDANITARFNGDLDAATVNGATVQLRDASNAVVPSAVTYDPANKLVTINPDAPLAPGGAYTVFVQGGAAGVHSVTGTALPANFTSAFNATESSSYAVWNDAAVPAVTQWEDTRSVELGVKFQCDLSGLVTGVRFYKGAGNTGVHTGSLWTTAGTLLATATFTGETASGWQQVNFSSPVSISAGTTYVASYFAPSGRYSVDVGGFAAHAVSNGPLRALRDGAAGPNGLYAYSSTSRLPNQTVNSNNYWVSPVFYRPTSAPSTPDLAAADDSGASNTDDLTNALTPHFTGTARPGSTVRIFANGIEVGSGVADALQNYSVAAIGLAEGEYNITAGVNEPGPLGTPITVPSPASLHVRIDRSEAAPSAPDLDPATDSGDSSTDNVTNSTSLAFGGTAPAGDKVTLLVDGVAVGQQTVGSGGTYAFSVPVPAEGVHQITARAEDPAGNVSVVSTALAVTVDRSIAVPSAPDLQAGSDSGSDAADDLTNAAALTFDLAADPGSTVTVFSDGVALGQASAGGGGSYQFTATSLAEGTHAITAQAQDPAGNVSAVSGALNVTVDRSVAAPAPPDLDTSTDSGASNTDDLTNAAAPVFTGTADPGSSVTLYADGDAVGTTVADGTGQYSLTLASPLAEGVRQVTARQQDAAGNISAPSAALAVTADRSVNTPAAPDLQSASDSGTSDTDNVTNAASPVIAGDVEPGSTVTVFSEGVALGTATANGAGLYTFTLSSLGEGTFHITAVAQDPAGNVSAASAPLTLTVDRSAPATSAPDLDAASDTGSSNTDDLTNAASLVFGGTVEPGSIVTLLSDGVALGQTTADGSGNYQFTASTLTEGVHQITARLQDAAGNLSSASAPLAVTIDRTAPAAPAAPDLAAASDSGSSSTDNLTNVNAPLLTGTATPLSAVTVFSDGVMIGQTVSDAAGAYSLTASPLGDGAHQITARAVDAAGNVSAASAALAVTVDRSAPVADVVDVTPDPRNTTVAGVQLTFSEPVTGLTLASLSLTRNGTPLSLAGATLTGPAADGRTYTLNNLTAVTGTVGTYQAKFTAAGSGVADAAGNAAADDAIDSWQYANAAPTNNSLTPAASTDPVNTYRTFTAAYRDANGASDLSLVYLRVNDFSPIMMDCLYDVANNKLFLRDEAGVLRGGFAPGSANVIDNGHGALDCALTTASVSGTTTGVQLTVNWRISAGPVLTGPNVLYLRSRDRAGLDTGYQRMSSGVWNVTGGHAPSVSAPTPLAPSTAPGVAQQVTATYSDPDGWQNIGLAYLRANADLPWMLDAVYNASSDRLYLRGTNGALLGGFAPGSANVISNGHGSLNCAAVTVAKGGTTLTVNWNLTAGPYLAGPNRLFVRARDLSGGDTGYVEAPGAVWTVTGNAAPTNVSVAPATSSNAAGTFRTLAATYDDANGAANLNFVYVSLNAADPARRLQAVYNLQTNKLFLLADDNVTLLGGFAPGSANVISNSKGSLNCAATVISITGSRMIVTWNLSATGTLAGSNTVSLRSRDRGALDTGFTLMPGVTWNIT